MKVTSLLLLVLTCLLSAMCFANPKQVDLEKIEFNLIDGKTRSLNAFKGKAPVYIKFWASWCVPCLKEMPHFSQAHKKYGDSIEIISVNLGINDSLDDVKRIMGKYDLAMPTAIDTNGKLAEAFNFVGTPYHVIFDKEMNLLHRGHSADESLDNKLALLAAAENVEIMDNRILMEREGQPLDLSDALKGKAAIYFTATWCDWYLKETKPSASKNCAESQTEFNKLAKNHKDVRWFVVVSNLWTGASDLADYTKKYELTVPSRIDGDNGAFIKFGVNHFPTLLVLQDGQEKYRTTTVKADQKLADILSNL